MSNLFELLNKSSTSALMFSKDNNENTSESKLNKLFKYISDDSQATSEDSTNYKNFIWKLLINQFELDFYTSAPTDTPISSSQNETNGSSSKKKKTSSSSSLNASKKPNDKLTKIINDYGIRGYCDDYFVRTCVNDSVKSKKSYNDCLKEYVILNLC
jgi:sulfite reductase alpha subunit-like flavoprotein